MDTGTIFKIIAEVGFPIAAAMVAGVFVYFVINYILESVVKAIKGMQIIIQGLDNRVKTMNHDIIRVDSVVSAALGLRPDLDRIARADGKNDARKD
jgi:predicted benzoate:H+ symporter BenE